jgi:uncharacterized repeat protein (TIGR02543 family)
MLAIAGIVSIGVPAQQAKAAASGANTIEINTVTTTTESDWSFASGVLTLNSGSTEYKLTSSDNGAVATVNRIVVAPGITGVTVTLDNVNIAPNSSRQNAVQLGSGSSVTIALEGTNSLKGYNDGVEHANYNNTGGCGIRSNSATITIGGTGTLFVSGGKSAAAIGGQMRDTADTQFLNSGDITINSGTIFAWNDAGWGEPSVIGAAGFAAGASSYGNPGIITVNGGTVLVYPARSADTAIGGSEYANSGTINLLGGIVIAGGFGIGLKATWLPAGNTAVNVGPNATVIATRLYSGATIDSNAMVIQDWALSIGDPPGVMVDMLANNVGAGTISIKNDKTILSSQTLSIPSIITLQITSGKILTNNGELIVNGNLVNNGTLVNNGIINNGGVVTYNAKFDLQSGGGSMADFTLTKDKSMTLPQYTGTKAGSRFVGWDTDPSADEVVVKDGATVTNLGGATGLVNLYAVWQAVDATTTNYYNHIAANWNTDNPTTIEYCGYKWNVVGINSGTGEKVGIGTGGDTANDGTGLPAGNVTLLLDKSNTIVGTNSFNPNTGGNDNYYNGSNLQTVMNGIYTGFSCSEKSDITPRTLTGESSGFFGGSYNDDHIAGTTIENQSLWPLSVAEANQFSTDDQRLFPNSPNFWWLRTPGNTEKDVAEVYINGLVDFVGSIAYIDTFAIRPALYLNLSSAAITPNIDLATTCTANYDLKSGGGSNPSQTMTYGIGANLTNYSGEKYGYTFEGWDTDSSADTVVYNDGATVTNLSTTNGATVTLYAVWKDKVSNITADPTETSITQGQTGQLAKTITAQSGMDAVTWSSSNPTIATVNGTGLVTGVAVGDATITVKSTINTLKYATATVHILPIAVTGVTVAPTSTTITYGETAQLVEIVAPVDAYVQTVTWSSSNTNVATVNASGLVTSKSAGDATITAKSTSDQTKYGTTTVTVDKKLLTVSLGSVVIPDRPFISGTLTAPVTGVVVIDSGIVNSDAITVSSCSGDYADDTVDTGKAVDLTCSLAGPKAGSYTITSYPAVNGTILDYTEIDLGGHELEVPTDAAVTPESSPGAGDGFVTLPTTDPEYEVIVDDTTVVVPGGSVIHENGTVTVPAGNVTINGQTIDAPAGSVVNPATGDITLPNGKVAVTQTKGSERLALSSATITQGKTLTINGSGFTPNELVRLELHTPTQVLSASVTVNASGKFTLTKAVTTATAVGNYQVVAYDNTSNIQLKSTNLKVVKPAPTKPGPVSAKAKKAKGSITFIWGSSGLLTTVEIYYRVKGTSKWKVVRVSSADRKKIKLKRKKTYQFQLRSYKTVNGKNYYSTWTKKTVKL